MSKYLFKGTINRHEFSTMVSEYDKICIENYDVFKVNGFWRTLDEFSEYVFEKIEG